MLIINTRFVCSPDEAPPPGSLLSFSRGSTQNSPRSSRLRKTRTRDRHSCHVMRGTNKNTIISSALHSALSSSLTSPTKVALHNELEMKAAASRLELEKDIYENVIPSNMKAQTPPGNNLNDVCFGCEGGCSDVTCASRRAAILAIQATAGIAVVESVSGGVNRSGSCSSSSGSNHSSSRSSQGSRHGDVTNQHDTAQLCQNTTNNIITATTTTTSDTNDNGNETENGNSHSGSTLPVRDILCVSQLPPILPPQGNMCRRTSKRLHSVESCDEHPDSHVKLTEQMSLCMHESATTASGLSMERRASGLGARTHRVSLVQ